MRRIRFAALLIAFIGLLGACAEDEPALQEPDATAEATAAASPQTEDMTVATVGTADSDLGTILVDAEGMTLYVFLQDADGKSNCKDACAETWPSLTVDGDPTGSGEGIDAEMLGTTEREDGDTQVTYNDRPLYTYAPDSKAGDTKGQGVADNWYVVGTDGEPIKK